MTLRFRIGDFICYIIHDGFRSIGSMTKDFARKFIFGDAPLAEVEVALKPFGGIGPETQIPFNYLLAEKDGCTILIDTGCGEQADNAKNQNEPAGLLLTSLGEAGFNVGDVNTVIVSHGHWDHFGGAVTGGRPTFPKAEYMLSMQEAKHIKEKPNNWASEYLRVLNGKLRLFPDINETIPGVTVTVFPGHTPGISITKLSSGGETLVYTSDLILHQAHIEHLSWIPSFETDKKAALVSRTRLIEDAYKQEFNLFVPHIPSVVGRIRRSESSYCWIASKLKETTRTAKSDRTQAEDIASN